MYPLCLTWCNLKLTLKKRKKLILCGVLLIGTIWLIFSHNAAQIRKEVNILRALPCSDTHSREIISSICSLYKKGEIVGDLCEPLCNKKLVQFVRCLNYKHGKFVVHVECTQICKQHETVPAVLKMIHEDVSNNTLKEIDKELLIHMHLQDKIDTINIHANTITAESLSLLIQDLLASEYGITPREGQDMLNVLWDEYGNYFTGTSTNLIFARSFWSVVRQNEYRISKVFSDWDVFPKIYGSCGALYLAENAPALTTFSKMSYFISGYPSWTSRAKTAISILHLVRMMETMEHPLHLCDIKSPHFGVMPNNEIKFIDADTVFADETLSHDLGAPNCSDHADCAFFDCDGWCQKSTGRCIPLRTNNNLQMVCAKIFKASFLSTYGGLLSSPPSAVAEELTNLVNSCAQDVTQLYQEQIEMRKPDLGVLFKLTEYLTKSLNMETNS